MSEQMPQFNTFQEENLERVKTDPIGLYLEQLDTDEKYKEIPSQVVDLSFMSKEQRAETLWALFQEVKSEVSGRAAHRRGLPTEAFLTPEASAKGVAKAGETKKRESSDISPSVGLLKALYADEEARATYIEANEPHPREIKSIKNN